MQDMTCYSLFNRPDYECFTNAALPWLYNDFPPSHMHELYGRGFTLYCRLPSCCKPVVLEREEILEKIKSRYFNSIIYTSVRRESDLIDYASKSYSRSEIISIDGNDDSKIDTYIASRSLYLKRELLLIPRLLSIAYPLNFVFPFSSHTTPLEAPIEHKTHILSPIEPSSRYSFCSDEEYYSSYSKSFFALTTLKGGWDCLRHYEIIFSGSLPFFPDISYCPSTCLSSYPKHLQLIANKLFRHIIKKGFDQRTLQAYSSLRDMFSMHTKRYLSDDHLFHTLNTFLFTDFSYPSPPKQLVFLYNCTQPVILFFYIVKIKIVRAILRLMSRGVPCRSPI